jgi:hypothetical protein
MFDLLIEQLDRPDLASAAEGSLRESVELEPGWRSSTTRSVGRPEGGVSESLAALVASSTDHRSQRFPCRTTYCMLSIGACLIHRVGVGPCLRTWDTPCTPSSRRWTILEAFSLAQSEKFASSHASGKPIEGAAVDPLSMRETGRSTVFTSGGVESKYLSRV